MGYDLKKYAGASKWLKAEDLEELDMDAAIVTITEVFEDQFEARDGKPAEDKLCLRFKEFDKPLGLNITNTKAVMGLYQDDTDKWVGRKVKLRIGTANNPQQPGTMVNCLRITAPPAKKSAEAAVAASLADDDAGDPYKGKD